LKPSLDEKGFNRRKLRQRREDERSGSFILKTNADVVGWDFDFGFGEHDVEGEFGAAAEMEFVPVPPFFPFRQLWGTTTDAREGEVGVTFWQMEESAGSVEEQENFFVFPDAFDDFGIVKTKLFKADDGLGKKGADKAEIFFVELGIAVHFDNRRSFPAGVGLATFKEFASEEEHW
jgi:hypothetical protein